MIDKNKILTAFQTTFNAPATALYFAPGRINLIGEHTDYNGGHVFPCAITLGTYAAVSPRQDNEFHLFSGNLPENGIVNFSTKTLAFDQKCGWANYPKGMAYFLAKAGANFQHGLNLYFLGNLPNGSGLSSSASIELLMGTVLNHEFNLHKENLDLVKIGQLVENDYIGVNSGIMDQFAVGMGRADQAILLDTNTLAYEYAPIELGENVIIIMNTKKRRELADSKYNERRSQCEAAVAKLQAGGLKLETLGELDNETFDENSYLINDATLIKRARHAVSENQRTIAAVKALHDHNLTRFGKLMNASHVSLDYDYEVTGIELDTLVKAAWQQPGVIGARMTGAGFGGCAIAIVAKDQVAAFEKNVGTQYAATIGYPAEFYLAEVSDGPQVLAI